VRAPWRSKNRSKSASRAGVNPTRHPFRSARPRPPCRPIRNPRLSPRIAPLIAMITTRAKDSRPRCARAPPASNAVSPGTGNPAFSPAGVFDFNRHQDEFEQVMAYYWITEAQNYIQRLGFGTGLFPPVNKESQRVRINQWGADNSFFTDTKDELRFGKGGVDDAEDAEVILHEYGHAIQDSQQTPFGFGFSVEARSIGEGFSDYWAVTVSSLVAPTPDPACVADWDSVSYTSKTPHCLRRVDTNLHYPQDLNGAVHHDGMIWSRALWDIRAALGATQADTIILNAHFGMPDPTMPQLAAQTVAVAKQIYGNGAATKVKAAFVARGIL